jgi:hypothetical protein
MDPDTLSFKTRYQKLVDSNRLRIKYAVIHLIRRYKVDSYLAMA